MRIVAGRFRGRQLTAPVGQNIRPTLDRVREAIFNKLRHGIAGFSLEGARVLDLFAGTGALGLEALSQGAGFCLFVENDPEARGLIRENIERLGLTGATKIYRRDATDLGKAGTLRAFDLVLLDPPYAKGLGEPALAAALSGGWLGGGAVVVWQESVAVELQIPSPLVEIDQRHYGETRVHFLRLNGP